jgi:hypothetical protein
MDSAFAARQWDAGKLRADCWQSEGIRSIWVEPSSIGPLAVLLQGMPSHLETTARRVSLRASPAPALPERKQKSHD